MQYFKAFSGEDCGSNRMVMFFFSLTQSQLYGDPGQSIDCSYEVNGGEVKLEEHTLQYLFDLGMDVEELEK